MLELYLTFGLGEELDLVHFEENTMLTILENPVCLFVSLSVPNFQMLIMMRYDQSQTPFCQTLTHKIILAVVLCEAPARFLELSTDKAVFPVDSHIQV